MPEGTEKEEVQVVAAVVPAYPAGWTDRVGAFAANVGKSVGDVTAALATVVGEPGDQALAILADEESAPFGDIAEGFKGLSIPKGVLRKNVATSPRVSMWPSLSPGATGRSPVAATATAAFLRDRPGWLSISRRSGGYPGCHLSSRHTVRQHHSEPGIAVLVDAALTSRGPGGILTPEKGHNSLATCRRSSNRSQRTISTSNVNHVSTPTPAIRTAQKKKKTNCRRDIFPLLLRSPVLNAVNAGQQERVGRRALYPEKFIQLLLCIPAQSALGHSERSSRIARAPLPVELRDLIE